MDTKTQILTVEKDSCDGLIVTFSDGTSAGYVIEELLDLRPHREPVPRLSKSAPHFATVEDGSTFSALHFNVDFAHCQTAKQTPQVTMD